MDTGRVTTTHMAVRMPEVCEIQLNCLINIIFQFVNEITRRKSNYVHYNPESKNIYVYVLLYPRGYK